MEWFGCRAHQASEALWALVGDGLAYLDRAGQGSGTDNWRWRASALGIKVAAGGGWEPRDPTGYLKRLRERAPSMDVATLRYVEEALGAFNARCFLATSVMLGVASESAFGHLAQAFIDGQPGDSPQMRKLLTNPASSYYKRFEEFRKRLEPIRSDLPTGLADNLTLDAIADLLRVSRNDAGHPTGQIIDEDTAFTHLQVAARYLVKMTELTEHLKPLPF
ncbi:hypothetical protein GCM10023328_45300 [Modestobacter marinus]|uniref:Uncharacterized protein n=1 Tax=Modestobacter marinus TaxID=477641 RepID=A0A846LWG4_9ACTN|nr:hypothetical protein [Modestobacter marinus]NIH70075.1 hypothetical protein [Modestobacter marinus]GGL85964.1 hypothetical protein GCM10011589_47970 [Modestobacter marinus]